MDEKYQLTTIPEDVIFLRGFIAGGRSILAIPDDLSDEEWQATKAAHLNLLSRIENGCNKAVETKND